AGGDACLPQGLQGAAGTEDLEAQFDQTTGEGDEPPLVGDTEESEHGVRKLRVKEGGDETTRPREVSTQVKREAKGDRGGSPPPRRPEAHCVPAGGRPAANFAVSPRWPRGAWPALGSRLAGCAPG